MLRNFAFFLLREVHTVLLNEVLSLNAQDLPIEVFNPAISCFLNEVLSLNAQEFGQGKASYADIAHFLNEVLSLNAQESIYQNLATIPGTLPQ